MTPSIASRGAPAGVAMLVACLALAASPARAAEPCPPDSVMIHGVLTTSTAASLDTTHTDAYGNLVGSGGWDLALGELRVYDGGQTLGSSWVATHDAYDVVGPPAGTPVALTAVLDFDAVIWTGGCGGSGCWGYLEGWVVAGGNRQVVTLSHDVYAYGDSMRVQGTTLLPVTIVAGQPLDIGFVLQAFRAPGGNQQVRGAGHLRFTGAEATGTVVSCQGYGAAVVPARRSTWGAIKTRYR